jgi:hypothetical protein
VPTTGPTPTATEPVDPLTNSPLCPDHDPHAYHTLWNEALGCHYDHEHKDNPHEVDYLFGTDFYQWAGGEISYPWQTFAGANSGYPTPPAPGVYENERKHIGYAWTVRRNLPCPEQPCITDFRIEMHSLMGPVDAVVRFHSFWAEVRVRHHNNQYGIIRRGGWMDFGHLEVNANYVPLPGDPNQRNTGNRRLHGDSQYATWYGTNNNDFVGLAVMTDDAWAPVSEDTPDQTELFCPDFQCDKNFSTFQPHVIAIKTLRYGPDEQSLDGSAIDRDPRSDYITAHGYTDRHGVVVHNCTAPALDCVPFAVLNMPVVEFLQYRGDMREYDISPAPEHWIHYPTPVP